MQTAQSFDLDRHRRRSKALVWWLSRVSSQRSIVSPVLGAVSIPKAVVKLGPGASLVEGPTRGFDTGLMALRPLSKGDHWDSEVAPQIRELVLHARGNGREDRAGDQAVALQPAQRRSEHFLRNSPDLLPQLAEAPGSPAQRHDNENGPFVAYARQDLANGPAIGGEVDGVPWFHRGDRVTRTCLLAVTTLITNVVSVTKGYCLTDGEQRWR
jgi:hypothetical protein